MYLTFTPTPHCKNVVRNAIYLLKEKTKSAKHDEKCTDTDRMKLSMYWGYAIKQNKEKPFDEFMNAIRVVLKHHFNNHQFCGRWCPVKRENTSGRYRNKEVHGKLYEHLKIVHDRYASEDNMRQNIL
jgi:hypothetical protein